MPEISMPRLSDSMEEGTIVRWLKQTGDEVARGEELVEIETDKADVVHESDANGRLEILAEEGATLPIGAPIAHIGEGAPAANGAAPSASATPASAPSTSAAARPSRGTRIKASPVARRLAADLGVDLAAIEGSGPGGRVVKADVEARTGAPAATPATEPSRQDEPAVADTVGAKGAATVQELSRLQQVVARRMSETKATVPDFTVTTEVDMDAAAELRASLKEVAAAAPAPSLNDMVVRACALALRDHPRVNGAYRDGRFELYEQINIGIAVAAEDALVVPVVKDADQLPLRAIAGTTRRLGESVRAGTITPPALSGGTFTVSNLGMFGVTEFTAILNAGQAAILAVGAVRDLPVLRDGELRAGSVMTLSLTCDHRILYGADAAAFLARVRDLLEAPLALVS